MSKLLSQLLGQPEHLLTQTIKRLEEKNGYPSHDIRLSAANEHIVRIKLAQLGLDPDDTTARELYHALQSKFQDDSRQFQAQFRRANDGFDASSAVAARLVSDSLELPQTWALKTSSAKELLRKHPPKKVMRRLHYRSIESLLKREDLSGVYLLLDKLESATWNKAHEKLIRALDTTAFELRPVKLCSINSYFSPDYAIGDHIVFNISLGILAVAPADDLLNAPLLAHVMLLLDNLNSYKHLKVSKQAAKISPVLAWWEDMDFLIAELDSQHVSLNLCDAAMNHLYSGDFQDRTLEVSRRSFWKELADKYQNQLTAEEDKLADLNQKFEGLQASLNQPAFEYAGDI